jgi:hypothetical protein
MGIFLHFLAFVRRPLAGLAQGNSFRNLFSPVGAFVGRNEKNAVV